MIRSELIQKLADENPHLYQRGVERIVNTVFEEITDTMARGDRVELRGFGGAKFHPIIITAGTDRQRLML